MTITSQGEARRMLAECLSWAEAHEDEAEARMNVHAFEDMKNRVEKFGLDLTDKQIAWIRGVHEKLFDVPHYENLVSSGRVPRGKEVPTPPVLQSLPKRPPARRKDDDDP